MGAKITISKDIIPWLLQLAGDNAPEEILEEIRSWETGKNPTLNQINEISRKLHIPFGYFFLQSPCTQINPSPRFRSFGNQLNDDISKELKDTIYKMEDIQDWLIDYADEIIVQKLMDDVYAVHVAHPFVGGGAHVDYSPLRKGGFHLVEYEKNY